MKNVLQNAVPSWCSLGLKTGSKVTGDEQKRKFLKLTIPVAEPGGIIRLKIILKWG
jgi:hypothetical protein